MRLSAIISETGARYWDMFVEITDVKGNAVRPELAASLAEELFQEEVQRSTPDNCTKEGEIERDGKKYHWRIAFDLHDEDIEWETDEGWEPLSPDRIPWQWAKPEKPKARKRRVA